MSFPLGKNIGLLIFRILEYSYSYLNLSPPKKNWKKKLEKKENSVDITEGKIQVKENLH